MPRGFARGFGRGWPHGPYGWGSGHSAHPFGGPYGYGRGRRNAFPFCRNSPSLPRWWWPYSPYGTTPNAGSYATAIFYNQGYGHSSYQASYIPSYGYPTSAPPTGVPTI